MVDEIPKPTSEEKTPISPLVTFLMQQIVSLNSDVSNVQKLIKILDAKVNALSLEVQYIKENTSADTIGMVNKVFEKLAMDAHLQKKQDPKPDVTPATSK